MQQRLSTDEVWRTLMSDETGTTGSVQVGAPAPDFRARAAGQADEIVLSALRGRPVVLAFYPVTFGFMTGIGG
jgi:hypothetical protein